MKCPRCGGTGIKIDPSETLRLRISAKVTQKLCAARMGISQAYLCDLEYGNRDWDAELYEKFKKAIK